MSNDLRRRFKALLNTFYCHEVGLSVGHAITYIHLFLAATKDKRRMFTISMPLLSIAFDCNNTMYR